MKLLLDIAESFLGIKEVPGTKDNPLVTFAIAATLARGDMSKVGYITASSEAVHDETAWCSAFAHLPVIVLASRYPMLAAPWSLRARAWLLAGWPVDPVDAVPGDVAVFKRGDGAQPGPDVIEAPGHVAYLASTIYAGDIAVIGGNQSNAVTHGLYPRSMLLGIRRIVPAGMILP